MQYPAPPVLRILVLVVALGTVGVHVWLIFTGLVPNLIARPPCPGFSCSRGRNRRSSGSRAGSPAWQGSPPPPT